MKELKTNYVKQNQEILKAIKKEEARPFKVAKNKKS